MVCRHRTDSLHTTQLASSHTRQPPHQPSPKSHHEPKPILPNPPFQQHQMLPRTLTFHLQLRVLSNFKQPPDPRHHDELRVEPHRQHRQRGTSPESPSRGIRCGSEIDHDRGRDEGGHCEGYRGDVAAVDDAFEERCADLGWEGVEGGHGVLRGHAYVAAEEEGGKGGGEAGEVVEGEVHCGLVW